MRVVVWNVRGASEESLETWSELRALNFDVALLQEVNGVPDFITETHRFIGFQANKRMGGKQKFKTGVLVRKGGQTIPVRLASSHAPLQEVLEAYSGNLVHVCWERAPGDLWHLLSCYSPAWPLYSFKPIISRGIRAFKSRLSGQLWLTDIIHRYVGEQVKEMGDTSRWVVAGDFNSATTFDWEKGQNQEVIDNLRAVGFEDAISALGGKPVPTFRHSRGSVKHQLDYLYLNAAAREGLETCEVLDNGGIFERGLSDHLPLLGTWSNL